MKNNLRLSIIHFVATVNDANYAPLNIAGYNKWQSYHLWYQYKESIQISRKQHFLVSTAVFIHYTNLKLTYKVKTYIIIREWDIR